MVKTHTGALVLTHEEGNKSSYNPYTNYSDHLMLILLSPPPFPSKHIDYIIIDLVQRSITTVLSGIFNLIEFYFSTDFDGLSIQSPLCDIVNALLDPR